MKAGPTNNRLGRRWSLVALLFVACFALAACGPLGSDDEAEPTATSETLSQPTEQSSVVETEEAPATEPVESFPSTPTMPPVQMDSTPDLEPIEATPDTGSLPASTPVFNGVMTTASPVAAIDATPIGQTPAAVQNDGPPPDGDGTSGAVPATDETPDDGPILVEETPASQEGTPSASPVAMVAALDDLDPAIATSCEPDIVPVIAIEDTAFRTNSDVNVRFGPGADCDMLSISPVGAFMPVTIVGGPVQREGEDLVWVQVEVAGETGWIVIDAVEPIES